MPLWHVGQAIVDTRLLPHSRIEVGARKAEGPPFVMDELALDRVYAADLEVELDLYFAYEPDLEVELDLYFAYEPDLEVELFIVHDDLEDEWFGAYDETREYVAPFDSFDDEPTSPFRRFGNWLLGRAA